MLSWRTDSELRRAFAGRRVYVPRRPRGAGFVMLQSAIGPEAANELVRVHGGETITVPLSGRRELKAELQRRWAAGASVAELAARAWPVQLSQRTIQRYLLGSERAPHTKAAKATVRLAA